MIKTASFLKSGEKEVISFMVIPQNYKSKTLAIEALHNDVLYYENSCGRSFNKFTDAGNPFLILIVHGANL